MATWLQPWESNHSRMLSSSRVVVPKVRSCFCTFPSFRTINKQATTVAWCTSSPQPRSTRVSITPPWEAIAAPQVCYRHCHASFLFLGATKSDTFTDAGQSRKRDLCRHRERTTFKQSPTMNACTTETDPASRSRLPNPFSCEVVRRRRMKSRKELSSSAVCRFNPAHCNRLVSSTITVVVRLADLSEGGRDAIRHL